MHTLHSLLIKSIENARKNISKIDANTNEGKEILQYSGYTGTKTRHFYNNICSGENTLGQAQAVRYLEIGTWYGSSSISALYKNNVTALFIDNWSQFNGDPNILKKGLEKFSKDSTWNLIESDCWHVDLEKLPGAPFNVYLYDGGHTELDHYKALTYYYPVLDDTFIFIVDDWNWADVRDGTMRAINELTEGSVNKKAKVLFRHEEFLSHDDVEGMPEHNGKNTWWNGIGVFLVTKI
jgi:hypothetical protein